MIHGSVAACGPEVEEPSLRLFATVPNHTSYLFSQPSCSSPLVTLFYKPPININYSPIKTRLTFPPSDYYWTQTLV